MQGSCTEIVGEKNESRRVTGRCRRIARRSSSSSLGSSECDQKRANGGVNGRLRRKPRYRHPRSNSVFCTCQIGKRVSAPGQAPGLICSTGEELELLFKRECSQKVVNSRKSHNGEKQR